MEQTIGQQLRQAREAQKLTLEQAASATLMRERYLRALEEDNYTVMPSLAQARGFLRAYASYLKLDPNLLLQDLDSSASIEVSPTSPQKSQAPAPAAAPINYEQADKIFVDIGLRLQQRRDLLGLSLDDVARYTHLRRHYLQALESGRLDDLPSPVQGRGMLDNYATFLGMDTEPLLLRFAEGLQARLSARQVARNEPPSQPKPRRRRSLPAPLRRLLSPDILIGVTFAIFLVIFVVWGAIRIFSMNGSPTAEPTAPSIADVLLATETPGPTPSLLAEPPTVAVPQVEAEPGAEVTAATQPIVFPTGEVTGVQVYVTVVQRAWMRAIVDGKVEFEGRVIAGNAYPFVGESLVEILTSNGAALQVFFNQQDLGPLGTFGQVVDRIYTPQGILTPTPTITRTPTLMPPATATPAAPNLSVEATAPSFP